MDAAGAMRRLIFQVAVGEVPPFYAPCMASVKDYAERIGAHYIALTEPVLRIVPKASQRSDNALRLGYLPIFEKGAAFAYLGVYDQIAVIDADVFVMPTAPDVFDAAGDADFAAVLERELPLKPEFERKVRNYSRDMFRGLSGVWKWDGRGVDFHNMGVMVWGAGLKAYLRDDNPEEFIRRPEFEKFVNGEGRFRWSTDQVLLNWWIKNTSIRVRNLDWRWNCIYSYVKPEALKQSPHFVHFNLAANMPRKGAEIPDIIRGLL